MLFDCIYEKEFKIKNFKSYFIVKMRIKKMHTSISILLPTSKVYNRKKQFFMLSKFTKNKQMNE